MNNSYIKAASKIPGNWLRIFQNKLSRINMPEYTLFSIYSILTGISVGLAVVAFHEAINLISYIFFELLAGNFAFWGGAIVIILPALGMLVQSLMTTFFPSTAKKRGVSEVIKAVAIRGGFIRFRTTLFHFIAPVINIGSGGTVGPEGPAAQLGGGVASKLGQLIGISDARRRMFTAAGAGAAISAVFNTPLGGIFFALEIVLLNDFQSATFSALILASVSASAVSRIFLGDSPAFQFDIPSIVSYSDFYLFIALGIAAGILSIAFIRYSSAVNEFFKKKVLKVLPKWLLMVAVGLIVGVAGYFYKDIFGIGYKAINKILAGTISWDIVLILLALKFLLVPMILNSGGFGGVFAPSLFLGACFGFLFATGVNNIWDLNLDTTTFVLVSMGAVLGGVNSIPISAILIIFEMTKDYSFMLPLMLAVVISTTIVQLVVKGSVHVKHLEEQGYTLNQGRQTSILRSYFVKDVMKTDIVLIPEDTPLPVLVGELLESHHNTFYIVNKEKKLTGTISTSELRPIIAEYEQLRDMLVVNDIARHEVLKVSESDDLDYVLKLFGEKNVDELPVISKTVPGKVIASVWRQDVIALYNRESLKYNLADGMARELKSIETTQTSQVTEGFSIVEKKAPEMFIGKSLLQLRIRNNHGLEVLMIKRPLSPIMAIEEENKIHIPTPDYVIQSDDILVLFGADDKVAQTINWV
ncbi:MAG: chloride channel protein [Bacteroidetes bacterium]|nr:chloride channel protein [Bacteroidota bacterium]